MNSEDSKSSRTLSFSSFLIFPLIYAALLGLILYMSILQPTKLFLSVYSTSTGLDLFYSFILWYKDKFVVP
jgi:hypothetical protein